MLDKMKNKKAQNLIALIILIVIIIGIIFLISHSVPCTQNCSGKVCGDDGCGGSCGGCTSGSCSNGQCVSGTCTPSWQCSSWSTCSGGTQTRTCTDSNNCGTLTNKPATSQTCNTICNPSWNCGSWSVCNSGTQTRTCTDANNCGTTVSKPATIQSCGTCDKWRIISHPSWTAQLSQYHYDTFNIIFDFNIEPQSDGSVSGGLSSSQSLTNVNLAHSNNKLIMLVVGGWGYGPEFTGATNSANRAKFVQQLTDKVHTLGYDGLVFDWEEDVNNANLVQTIKDLRTSLNALNPKPLLMLDWCCDVTANSAKQVEPYVDSIDTMDYEGSVNSAYNALINAGVPASKIINGLGFYAYVNSASRTTSEVQFVLNNNMKGIEVWDSSEITGTSDPRTAVIRNLLGTGPACR